MSGAKLPEAEKLSRIFC